MLAPAVPAADALKPARAAIPAMERNQWYVRAVPAGKTAQDMTKGEMNRALCEEAKGDLEFCKRCLHKCLIGRRLLNWEDKKHFVTVGVPDLRKTSEKHTGTLMASGRTRDAYNAQRAQEAREKITRGLDVLKAGGTRAEAVKASGYAGWKSFYDAVIFSGRRNEIPDDRSNEHKHEEARQRCKECFDQIIAGKPMEQIAQDHGYKTVNSMVCALRENREGLLDPKYDNYAIGMTGLLEGKRRCTRNTKSPPRT